MKKRILSVSLVLMLLLMLVPFHSMMAAPGTWTDVSSFAQLKNALTDSSTTHIRFTDDIAVEKGGVVISPYKSELVIDGNGFILTEYDSNSASHTIRLEEKQALTNITLQNIEIDGRNEKGTIYVKYSSKIKDITLNYINVEYAGPQLTYNRYGNVKLVDSNLIIVPRHDSNRTAGAAIEAQDVRFEGNINIFKNAQCGSDEIILISNSTTVSTGLTVAAGAVVNVSSNQAQDRFPSSSGFIYFEKANGFMRFEDGSYFSYVGNDLFHQDKALNEFYVGQSAEVYIRTYGKYYSDSGVLTVEGNLTVEEDAVLYIVSNDNTRAYPALQINRKGTATFNNPREVFIFNDSNHTSRKGYAFGSRTGTGTFVFNNVNNIEYWHSAQNYQNLSASHRRFSNSSGSSFSASMLVDGVNVKSASTTSYNGVTPFTTYNANPVEIKVLHINGTAGAASYTMPEPYMPPLNADGWYEVTTFAELKSATTDKYTTHIKLAHDIQVAEGGAVINPSKPEFVLDGDNQTYTLTGYDSCSKGDTMRLEDKYGNLRDIFVQNINLLGTNHYGTIYVRTTSVLANTRLIYDNVNYEGSRLAKISDGIVILRDSFFKIVNGHHNHTEELARARHIILEGKVDIVKEAPNSSYEIFYIVNECSPTGLVIASGAEVNVINNQIAAARLKKNTGFMYFCSTKGYFEVQQDAYFNYVGNNVFHEKRPLEDVRIGERAQVYIMTYGDFYHDYGQMAVKGEMFVEQDAVLHMIALNNTEPEPVLQMKGTGKITFTAPKDVLIFNSSTNKCNTGLATGPWGCDVTLTFNDMMSVEYWNMNTNQDYLNLTNPTYDWRNPDPVPFDMVTRVTGSRVKAFTSNGYYGATPLNATTAVLKDINVIRLNGNPGKATINVVHQDMEDGTILKDETFEVLAGPYGPYMPETINGYLFVDATGDAPSGIIGRNATKTIIFNYKKATKDIEGSILWEDQNDITVIRPKDVTVNLYDGGLLVASVVATEAENWEFTFKDMLIYEADGITEKVYTIAQDPVPEGYDEFVNDFVITNRLQVVTVTVSLWDITNDFEFHTYDRPVYYGGDITVYASSYVGRQLVGPDAITLTNVRAPETVTFTYEYTIEP